MKTLLKIVKAVSVSVGVLFLAFVVYANWEEPSLADKLNLKPIQLVVFNLSKPLSTTDSTSLASSLESTTGVTASTVNPKNQTVSVTYHADEVNEEILKEKVEKFPVMATKLEFSQMEGPKCPIPMGYIDFVLDAKKALCFR
ncbi:heavy-metal-associated domain-containing protein [Cellulophaga sp. BC115SP]|uniref:heavy-metal-associated domain-containing protein n=1 Tax=Cellulophaga sp. BC115SP TaxID=2683263 RepID=UPI001411E5E1|nr:heavy-metal-associated domain-containing protein [Cellulophaga sp. BC115SP]NBB28371.1 hypothetical protein [Cellulophaga sp. BC115SP]